LIQWEAFDAFGVRPSEINSLLGGHQPEIRTPEPKLTDRVQRGLRLLRFIAKSAPLRRLGHEQIHQAYATCKRWRQEDLSSLSDQALIDRFEMVMNHTCEQQGLFFMQAASAGSLPMLIKLLERYIPGQGHSTAAALLSGGEPSVTALQAYRLQTLAVQAASEPSTLEFLRTGNEDWQSLDSNSIFRQQFADFLDEFGHRAIYESYLHQPRWREKPGYLLENIVALLDHDELNHRQRLQNTRQEAGEILKRKLPLWARRWAQVLAQKSTSESNDREAARSALTRFTEIGRLCLLEVGRRLCMRGHLQQVQQVFHLTPWEFAAALRDSLKSDAVQHRVHARQQLLEFWEKHPAPDVIGEAPQMQPIKVSSAHSAGSQWQGTPVGAGVASGMARIIRNPEDGMLLQPGEILIAPSTDPSWTPMFLKASAIVMETGGYLSHGAIVAREFGIPAVVNIPGILNALTDGDELEVNGSAGKVSRSS